MIDDMQLLKMLMENNPGQPASFILEQYAVYKSSLLEINNRIAAAPGISEFIEGGEQIAVRQNPTAPKPDKSDKESLTRGFTKRSLKVKPDEAILDEAIICCICGKSCQTLTERHLALHNGLTREGYIKLCGYEAGQPLMARDHLARMKANVLKAQKARKAKQASAAGKAPAKDRKKLDA